jgi:hypothetical protein
VLSPAKPTRICSRSSFRLAAPESIQTSALAPAPTFPGSLSFAGVLLLSFAAFAMWVTYYNNRPGFGKSTNQRAVPKEITKAGENITFPGLLNTGLIWAIIS